MKPCILVCLSFLSFVPLQVSAQGESAVPFLLIQPSTTANGMGSVTAAIISDDPVATIMNPAQLGMFGLHNYFSLSTYSPKTQWLPSFGLSDLTYDVLALNAGFDLSRAVELPFPVSIGIGYSRIDLNLGTFVRPDTAGRVLGTFRSFENSKQFSAAIGFDWFVQASIGWNFKSIDSRLTPVGGGQTSGGSQATPTATDFGVLVHAPIFSILQKADVADVRFFSDVTPLLDFTFGYARRNMSDKAVFYVGNASGDPLPRSATIGLSAEIGLTTKVHERTWKVVTFILAREAEDLLIVRNANGTFSYQSGLGDISFFKHVIQGKLSDDERADLHKGWQLNFGEMVYLRGGSFAESPNYGNRNYSTSGFGIRIGGVWKLLQALSPEVAESEVWAFITNHFDFGYDHAEYKTEPTHPLSDIKFNSITVILK